MPYPKKPTGTGPGPSDYYPNYHIAKPRLFDPYFEKLKPNPPEPLYDSEKLFPNPNYESKYDSIKALDQVRPKVPCYKFADEPFQSEPKPRGNWRRPKT